MRNFLLLTILLLLSANTSLGLTAHSQRQTYPQSWQDMKDTYVVRQTADWDCGPASVQTWLELLSLSTKATSFASRSNYQLEQENKIRISLATLQTDLAMVGLKTEGYKLQYEHLESYFTGTNLGVPLLLHLESPRDHFVVAVGIIDDNLVLADPAQGLVIQPHKIFCSQWSGYTLHLTGEPPPLPRVWQILGQVQSRLAFLQSQCYP